MWLCLIMGFKSSLDSCKTLPIVKSSLIPFYIKPVSRILNQNHPRWSASNSFFNMLLRQNSTASSFRPAIRALDSWRIPFSNLRMLLTSIHPIIWNQYYSFSITRATSLPHLVQLPRSTSIPDSTLPDRLPMEDTFPQLPHQTLFKSRMRMSPAMESLKGFAKRNSTGHAQADTDIAHTRFARARRDHRGWLFFHQIGRCRLDERTLPPGKFRLHVRYQHHSFSMTQATAPPQCLQAPLRSSMPFSCLFKNI